MMPLLLLVLFCAAVARGEPEGPEATSYLPVCGWQLAACPPGSICLSTHGRSVCVPAPVPRKDEMLFFVHIPKTAGTAFRLGLSAAVGPTHMCYDYATSRQTSRIIIQHVYSGVDNRVQLMAAAQGICWVIGGHVVAEKYVPFMGVRNTVSFIRDPLVRMDSEWRHMRASQGIQHTIAEFSEQARIQNRQARMLSGIPPEALGFLGLTEEYPHSIAMVRDQLKVNVTEFDRTVHRHHKGRSAPEVLQQLAHHHSMDIALFNRAQQVFATRLQLYRSGKPFVHGVVESRDDGVVRGWAWWSERDDPVALRMRCPDNTAVEVLADRPRPDLGHWKAPREGAVGFWAPVHCGRVEVSVVETGQVLQMWQSFRVPDGPTPPTVAYNTITSR